MKKYKLGDLLTIKNGCDHKKLKDGKYPVYGSGGIMRYVDSYLYDKESVLLPRKGTLSNIQYACEPFWTVDTIYYTELKSDLVNAYYLYRYLSLLDLSGLDSGTGVPSMTFDAYYNISVSLPPLPTQQKIAAVLSSLDKKIALNSRINARLEQMAKRLYEHYFVQFDFPTADGKPYKTSGGKMVYSSELKREIPDGWEVKRLGECLKHINTGLNPRDNFKLGNGNIKYITVKNLTVNGIIDFSGCDLIDENARLIVHERSQITKGDILFASISPLGRCYIIQEEPKDWDINESVFAISPNQEILSSEYLYCYLTSQWFMKKAEKEATGSIFTGIRMAALNAMPVIVPDKEALQLFTNYSKSIFQQKDKLFKENEYLTSLRDRLLPLLMNGQVSV